MTPKVGLYANFCGYTDVHPYEIVRVVSDKIIDIRAMDAKLANGWKPEMIPGGFCAHTVNNQSQEYDYASIPGAPLVRARLRKDGRWYSKQGRHSIAGKPHKFHDYNF